MERRGVQHCSSRSRTGSDYMQASEPDLLSADDVCDGNFLGCGDLLISQPVSSWSCKITDMGWMLRMICLCVPPSFAWWERQWVETLETMGWETLAEIFLHCDCDYMYMYSVLWQCIYESGATPPHPLCTAPICKQSLWFFWLKWLKTHA